MIEDDWRLLNNTHHLEGQCVDPINAKELLSRLPLLDKCLFCWDKVADNKHDPWYLPLDKSSCICEKCYKDFEDLFQWKLLDGYDIEW